MAAELNTPQTLACPVCGKPTPTKYKVIWTFKGELLSRGDIELHNDVIKIHNVSLAHIGNYSCGIRAPETKHTIWFKGKR